MFSGKLRSALIIGGQGIRARKLRTFLSMVSLFLGVLAVVAVEAGSSLAERVMLTDVELRTGRDGNFQLYVPGEGKATSIVETTLKGRSDAIGLVGMNAIIGEPGVRPINEGASPFEYAGRGESYYGSGPMVWCDQNNICTEQKQPEKKPAGQAVEVQVQALTGDVRQFKPFRPVSGQWLDFSTTPSLAPKIVLNEEAAKGLNQYKVPGEMMITGATHHVSPQIIGVIADGSSQPTIYMRLDELRTWLPSSDNVQVDRFRGGSGLQVLLAPGTQDLQQLLKARLVGAGTSPDQLHINEIQSKKRMKKELLIMRLIFLGMAALVLLIGIAGILNVGLATVGERVEEFALRRAVGMSRMLLAGIVLAETLLTGLLTAALAIGAGVAGLKVGLMMFGHRFPSLADVVFPWDAGVAGVVAGLVAGVLGGLIPAIRAAQIPIATVMRA